MTNIATIDYRGYRIQVRSLYAFIYHGGHLVETIRRGNLLQAQKTIDEWLEAR